MLLCIGPNDKIQVITAQAITTDVHTSSLDVDAAGAVTTTRKNTLITTATTTDVTAAVASGSTKNVKTINIRNRHATSPVDVTIQHTDGTVTVELYRTRIYAGGSIQYVEGKGWDELKNAPEMTANYSTADQAIGASVDAYLTGSVITISNVLRPIVAGTIFRWRFQISKTAAGTATSTINIRFGTAGTTADTARVALSMGTQTGVADIAWIEVQCTVRGPIGASAVVTGVYGANKTAANATGLGVIAATATSAAFDITTVTNVGLSVATGALAAYTVTQVAGEVLNI